MEGGYNLVARIAKLGGRREIGTALPLESQPAWLLLPERMKDRDCRENQLVECCFRHARTRLVDSYPPSRRPSGLFSRRDSKTDLSANSWSWAFRQYRHPLSRSHGSVCRCG